MEQLRSLTLPARLFGLRMLEDELAVLTREFGRGSAAAVGADLERSVGEA